MAEQCSHCGSSRLIPNLPLPDRVGDFGQRQVTAEVHMDGNPQGWFRKDTAFGSLHLTICGDCGHADLKAKNHRELYEKYLRSIGRIDESEAFAGNELECLSCGAAIASGSSCCPKCGWSWQANESDA
jgi:hypothetical protein